MCEHDWRSEYLNEKEYARCVKCGLTREPCNYCENECYFYSKYNVFSFSLDSKGNLDISSEHNDYDEIKINYCPICGKKL